MTLSGCWEVHFWCGCAGTEMLALLEGQSLPVRSQMETKASRDAGKEIDA
jgi:hypothetical protein